MLRTLVAFCIGFTFYLQFVSCTKEPEVMMPDPDPPKDTVHVSDPCAENVIHYQIDIRPILYNNCAVSGCHDAQTAQSGLVLDNFENTRASGAVTPFYLDSSSLYDRITRDGVGKMPPDPASSLSEGDISLIKNWILQGAEDYLCDTVAFCDTLEVSYEKHIFPIIASSCRGCHSGSQPPAGISLTKYSEIARAANSGRLLGSVAWWFGFSKMPSGGEMLPECEVEQIRRWVHAGAPDN